MIITYGSPALAANSKIKLILFVGICPCSWWWTSLRSEFGSADGEMVEQTITPTNPSTSSERMREVKLGPFVVSLSKHNCCNPLGRSFDKPRTNESMSAPQRIGPWVLAPARFVSRYSLFQIASRTFPGDMGSWFILAPTAL